MRGPSSRSLTACLRKRGNYLFCERETPVRQGPDPREKRGWAYGHVKNNYIYILRAKNFL